jgi:translation initiation factor 3 subunit E
MARFDLTPRLVQHLDRHLSITLLSHAEQRKLYRPDDIIRAKLEVIGGTKMVDAAEDEYKRLHQTDSVPQEMALAKEKVRVEACDVFGPFRH